MRWPNRGSDGLKFKSEKGDTDAARNKLLKISWQKWDKLIDDWIIGPKAERDRQILKRRLRDGICYEPLAEEFDMSVSQVKRIVYKGQKRLFSKARKR